MSSLDDNSVIERKRYCIRCDDRKTYLIKERVSSLTVGGHSAPYVEKYAICSECGDELYVPEVSDMNVTTIESLYEKLKREE